MRRVYRIIPAFSVLLLLLSACSNEANPENKAKEQGLEIFFEEYVHNYGEIEQDSDGSWSFAFKNLADEAIIINRVRSTCGCTIPSWPREPIEAGSGGEIEVKYNTATPGTFTKSIYVYSSASNSPVKLQIRGKVIPSSEDS